MDNSSSSFMLDNVIICNLCQKAMVYSFLTGGIKTGYVCRNKDCTHPPEIEEMTLIEAIRTAIEIVISKSNATETERDAVWRMLNEPPEIVSKWLSENFRMYVSATLSGKGTVSKVDYI